MLLVFSTIFPLFLIILLGAAMRLLHLVPKSWDAVLNQCALRIGLPAMLFSAVVSTPFSFGESWQLFVANGVLIVLMLVVTDSGGWVAVA